MDKAKRALFGLSCGHFFLDMYAAVLIPLYPVIASGLNINIAQISVVIGVGHSISSILQPVFGYVSDKLNKRLFMFFGLMFASIFMPLGYIAQNAEILTLCLIFGMMGNAFYHPQATIMIKEFYNDNIALFKAMGIFLGLGTIGYSIGPYLSSYVAKNFENEKFVLIGLVGILLAFVMLLFVPKIKKREVINKENFLDSVWFILKNKTCLFLITLTVVKSALIMSYGTYAPFIFKKFGFSLTNTGMIMTMFFIISGFSMVFASKLEKRINLKGVIITSYLPLLSLTILFIWLLRYNKFFAAAIFLLIALFVLLAAGCILAHAQKIVSKQAGTISGIIQGFTLAVGSLLLIPFGIIGDRFGVEYILILISLIAFFCAIYTIKTKHI